MVEVESFRSRGARGDIPLAPPISFRTRRGLLMSDFFVVVTQDKRESVAVNALDDLSRDVYYPRVLRQVRRGRRVVDVPSPFLPNHLFVADDGNGAEPLRGVVGVRGVLCVNGGSARVPASLVHEMMAREVEGFVRLDPPGVDKDAVLGLLYRPMRGDTRVLLFQSVLKMTGKTWVDCAPPRRLLSRLPAELMGAA